MKLYICKLCNYEFESEESVGQCPDCGKFQIRPASESETEAYSKRKSSGEDVWEE